MAEDAAPSRRPTSRRGREEHAIEFTRIVAFSDGVFAIAITLLTLNLEVPDIPSDDSGALGEALLDLLPHFFAYALSFAVVGRLWLVHHRFFATLAAFDGTLMASNLLYLGLIVLVPFSSDLLGTFGEVKIAVMVYAAILGLAGLVNWLMMRYSLRNDLIIEEERAATEPFAATAALGISGAFLLSIPVALFSAAAAQLTWLLALVFLRRQRRVIATR